MTIFLFVLELILEAFMSPLTLFLCLVLVLLLVVYLYGGVDDGRRHQ